LITTIYDKAISFFDSRFQLTYIVPSLIFWTALTILIAAPDAKVAEDITAWNEQKEPAKAFQLVAFAVWVIFFATLLSSQSYNITRFYEGYWPKWLGWLEVKAKALHRRRLEDVQQQLELALPLNETEKESLKSISLERRTRLLAQTTAPQDGAEGRDWRLLKREAATTDQRQAAEAQHVEVSRSLPPHPEDLLATRLGNILRSAELYPFLRYNLDAVVIWPRLYPLVEEKDRGAFIAAKASLDLALTISALAGVFSVFAAVFLLVREAPGLYYTLVVAGAAVISWAAYLGALGSAAAYADQVRVIFDLHRRKVFQALGLKEPANAADEAALWRQVDLLFLRAVREDPSFWKYEATK
jgi:hypothetical protein